MGWPGPMTHRQYLAWKEWLDEQWNRPSLEYYALQTARAMCRVEIKNLLVPSDGKPRAKLTKEQEAAYSKAYWMGITGMLNKPGATIPQRKSDG